MKVLALVLLLIASPSPALADHREAALQQLTEVLGTRALAEAEYRTAESLAQQTPFGVDAIADALVVLAPAFSDPEERLTALGGAADLAVLGRGGSVALGSCSRALAAIRRARRPAYTLLDPLKVAGLRVDYLFSEVADLHRLRGSEARRNLEAAGMLRRGEVEGDVLAYAVLSAVKHMGGGKPLGSAARAAR